MKVVTYDDQTSSRQVQPKQDRVKRMCAYDDSLNNVVRVSVHTSSPLQQVYGRLTILNKGWLVLERDEPKHVLARMILSSMSEIATCM